MEKEQEDLQEMADGVMLVHLFKKDNKIIYKMSTFDRLNENKPLGIHDLIGIGQMLAEVVTEMEKKDKPKIILN